MIDAQFITLGRLVSVQAGFPFRGSIVEHASGSVLAVQMKDVHPDSGVDWSGALRTELPGRKQPDWLARDDLLFVCKGTRFHAVCIDAPPMPAVCSPHLFHLRLQPGAAALPAFIAWQVNQPPFQRQLQQAAEGSSQLSIRRPVLESLSLGMPGLADQRKIVALAELARQERRLLHQLMRNREHQLQALAEKLVAYHVPPVQPVTIE